MLEALPLAFPATGAVSLAPERRIYSVSAFAGGKAQLEAALGLTLPDANRGFTDGAVTWLWSGPGTWLAIGDAGLESRLSGVAPHAAVTEQSDGRALFFVAGPHCRDILEKLVPIDLHESAFLAGHTALTLAGHIPVQIWREGETFVLACFRSFAAALHHALVQAETPRG
jgi:sarcosine oxidase subunit gamma